jgi:carboxylesterase type B
MVEALGLLGDHPIDEDCLHLNVWSPGLDAAARPVLVWIHGGAFLTGTGSAPIYDGARLASSGDVVVVTLDYRVGAWGFLHDPSLGPANRGLLDQLAALEWVRDHAHALGGDPARITVFGESAGAGSIVSLLAMPRARGLFQRAIVQSAAPAGMIDPEEAARRTAAVRSKLGLPGGETARLAEVPVEDLLAAQSACVAEGDWKTGMFFCPVVDGDVLPAHPPHAIAAGSARGVDLLIGTTADEMRLFLWGVDPSRVPEKAVSRALSFELPGTDRAGRPLAEVVRAAYARLRHARGEAADPASLLAAIQSDTRLRLPSLRVAEAHARHHRATRVYDFTCRSPIEVLGSCHALDLPFTFGTLDAPGMPEFAGNGPVERAVSDAMMAAWTGFAREGDPGGGALGDWPSYGVPDRWTMRIGPEAGVVADPFSAERQILDAIDFPDLPSPG